MTYVLMNRKNQKKVKMCTDLTGIGADGSLGVWRCSAESRSFHAKVSQRLLHVTAQATPLAEAVVLPVAVETKAVDEASTNASI